MADSFNRTFSYLRLSLLPVCNFRCVYCLPKGNPMEALHRKHLTQIEIHRLVTAFAKLGIKKVRLTGGEPTLRPDLPSIVKSISQIPGIETVALTTNGFRLAQIAEELKDAGLNALNVSVDSLIPERFTKITGHNNLQEVLDGIIQARAAGISRIKVNAVVLKGLNEAEIEDLIRWSEIDSIDLRFIELMATGDNTLFFSERHLDLGYIEPLLRTRGYVPVPREAAAGPADIWKRANTRGSIGLIRPYKKTFCESCNRLRVTSEGGLQLCLFGHGTLPLRPFLQEDGQDDAIQNAVRAALAGKQVSHYLQEGNYGTTRNLATMGG